MLLEEEIQLCHSQSAKWILSIYQNGQLAVIVCMLCFESPALPWQALANCSSRRANSSAQPSRCAINGQSFQDVQNFKQNCRLVRRILISGADKTESETKIT